MTQNAQALPLGTRAHFGFDGSMRRLRCVVSRADDSIMSAMNCCASSVFDRSGHRSSIVRPARDWPFLTCL